MGCGKSKHAVATENTAITKSKSKKKENVVVETATNDTAAATGNTLVEEKGESKKGEVAKEVVEKVGETSEITKEEVEGGAKEEMKSENVVATNEKIIGVGGSEESKDVVEEKELGEEAKEDTTKGL